MTATKLLTFTGLIPPQTIRKNEIDGFLVGKTQFVAHAAWLNSRLPAEVTSPELLPLRESVRKTLGK